ncbi:MAG: TonB family protein [Lacunisphaera sp.]
MRCYSFVGRRYGWITVLLAVMAMAAVIRAQDVIVGSPGWFFAGPPPDEMPKILKIDRPDYPGDMRKINEVGYVIVFRYVDATGVCRGVEIESTHLPFQRSVEEGYFQWKMSPAKRSGTPVGAWTWLPIIFNPKAAKLGTPDSIPRLLSVDLTILPKGVLKPSETVFVPVTLRLDESGAIVQAKLEDGIDERVRKSVEAALKNWRFAPARQGGKPVAAEIRLSVCCLSPWPKNSGEYVPPKVLNAVEPDYPYVMAKFGINAKVAVDFTVDRDGSVRNPVIATSDNPAFDEPALEAILKWKFSPGEIDGVRVKVGVRQPIQFSMNEGGDSLFELSGHADQSKFPPELRYDVPAKIRSVQIPVYPYAQRQENGRGKVTATVLVGSDGHVAMVKIRSADKPEFGQALTAALEGFIFDPALKDGKPTRMLINFEQEFDRTHLPDEEGDRLLALEKKHPERIVSAASLDLPLKPLSIKRPVFPKELLDKATAGKTVVEILIDEKGHAKLPRVISASDPAFGYAAVQAVSAWWFQPPHRNGKPVITRVRIPIDFNVDPSPAAALTETKPST